MLKILTVVLIFVFIISCNEKQKSEPVYELQNFTIHEKVNSEGIVDSIIVSKQGKKFILIEKNKAKSGKQNRVGLEGGLSCLDVLINCLSDCMNIGTESSPDTPTSPDSGMSQDCENKCSEEVHKCTLGSYSNVIFMWL